jgi:hypothetical protein
MLSKLFYNLLFESFYWLTWFCQLGKSLKAFPKTGVACSSNKFQVLLKNISKCWSSRRGYLWVWCPCWLQRWFSRFPCLWHTSRGRLWSRCWGVLREKGICATKWINKLKQRQQQKQQPHLYIRHYFIIITPVLVVWEQHCRADATFHFLAQQIRFVQKQNHGRFLECRCWSETCVTITQQSIHQTLNQVQLIISSNNFN